MSKRKVGQKARILLDSIDLEIMNRLENKNLTILKLAKAMNIKHNNLLPHLKKLEYANFVFAFKIPKSRAIELSLMINEKITSHTKETLERVNDYLMREEEEKEKK